MLIYVPWNDLDVGQFQALLKMWNNKHAVCAAVEISVILPIKGKLMENLGKENNMIWFKTYHWCVRIDLGKKEELAQMIVTWVRFVMIEMVKSSPFQDTYSN